jgi:hypothetical protein
MTRFRLTLKQHRFEIIGSTLACLGLIAAALFLTRELDSVVFPAGCKWEQFPSMMFDSAGQPMQQEPTRACQAAIDSFNSIRGVSLANVTQIGMWLAPFVMAIMLGAPLVAREVEQNTAPLSWALIGSRRRWLLGRVGSILIVFVPLMLALGLAGDILYGAQNPGVNPWASFEQYGARGVLVPFWGVAAFLGTVALGTLFGRSLPAVFVAVVICFFARLGGEYYFQRIVLEAYAQPLMTAQQMASGNYMWNPTDLTVSYRYYLDGKPFSGDVDRWYAEHTPPAPIFDQNGNPIGIAGPTPAATQSPQPSSGGSPDPNATAQPVPALTDPSQFNGSWGPTTYPFGFHGDRYWPVVAAESGILAGGSLFLASIAFFWVGRRRPY